LISLGAGIVVSLVFLAGRRWWARDLSFGQEVSFGSALFLVLVLALAQMNIHRSVLQAERRLGLTLAVATGTALAQLVLIRVVPRSLGSSGVLLTILIPITVTIGLMFWLVPNVTRVPVPSFRFVPDRLGVLTQYALGNLLFSQLWALPDFVYPLLTLGLIGPAASAHFAVTWLISSLLLTIPNSVAMAFLVDSSYLGDRMGARSRVALLTDLALLIPLALLIAGLAPVILGLFGADYARAAASLLRLLVLASLPGSVTSIYLTMKRLRGQVVALNALAFARAILAVASSFLLIGRLGLTGIGWGWLLAQGAMAVVLMGPLWRECGVCPEALRETAGVGRRGNGGSRT
jgi:O-antigen/teichoic acid export membrane protein